MAFDIDNIAGSLGLGNLKGGIYGIVVWVIWGLIILGVVGFIYLKWQNKKIYIYPVRIYRQRNNGMVKEKNTMGGYVKKGQITQFLIKIGRFKKKPADKLPLSEFMDEDDRVYYWQVSPEASLIQVRKDFKVEEILVANENFIEPTPEKKKQIIDKWISDLLSLDEYKKASEEVRRKRAEEIFEEQVELERNKLINITRPTYTPVSTDLKQQALSDINQYRTTLGVDINKQFAYFIIGVIAIIILGAIIFYIAVNKGDIPIITK